MVNNVIHATYIETYDINTIQNELSILAIHTPQSNTLKRFFHGLYEQYSKMKVLGCNFKIACASKQDLDPTLVGFEAGQIDPRDVMNPLLFKACTGEGINALLDQIYNAGEGIANTGSNLGHSIDQHIDASADAIKAYYSLLADDSFRKAHPQAGMTVMGLKPMVHKVVSTQPFKWNVAGSNGISSDSPAIQGGLPLSSNLASRGFGGQSGSKNQGTDSSNPTVFVSNGVTEMPWLDTAFSKVMSRVDSEPVDTKVYVLQQSIPRVYMGALVLPPSSGAQNLFFRISVVWHILFKDFRMAQDLAPVGGVGQFDDIDPDTPQNGNLSDQNGYFNMYHSSSKLAKDYGSFDTQGVESVTEVLQKGQ